MATNLLLKLATGDHRIPLAQVHAVAGYATLRGEASDYFAGWLTFHGRDVPVFDLNQVVCEKPTAETFGSRIILVPAADASEFQWIGLLASGVTDTVGTDAPGVVAFDLDLYLPMLMTLIPERPAVEQ
jgi:chemotaxis signal transduction protein